MGKHTQLVFNHHSHKTILALSLRERAVQQNAAGVVPVAGPEKLGHGRADGTQLLGDHLQFELGAFALGQIDHIPQHQFRTPVVNDGAPDFHINQRAVFSSVAAVGNLKAAVPQGLFHIVINAGGGLCNHVVEFHLRNLIWTVTQHRQHGGVGFLNAHAVRIKDKNTFRRLLHQGAVTLFTQAQ